MPTRQRFAACGITPDRLVLEGNSPRAEMLEAYNRVDIILSPFPTPAGPPARKGCGWACPPLCGGGIVFSPIIGESIAHNAGLADWIAENDETMWRKPSCTRQTWGAWPPCG